MNFSEAVELLKQGKCITNRELFGAYPNAYLCMSPDKRFCIKFNGMSSHETHYFDWKDICNDKWKEVKP